MAHRLSFITGMAQQALSMADSVRLPILSLATMNIRVEE